MSQFKYFPQTNEDIKKMLDTIGVNSIDDLFSDIPNELKNKEFNLESELSEIELRKEANNIAKKNKQQISFCGGGSYDVYVPSVINTILSRQEFLTSYTPYQAEISQGTLQYIFEYQSYICELTGMDVTNASMYDGATASFEAIMMACNQSRRKKVIISKTVNPNYLTVIKTYAHFKGYEVIEVEEKDLITNKEALIEKLDNDIACVVCAYPNYYGYLENFDFISLLKEKKIYFILISDPSTLSVIKTPKELGADICCGDAQTLGISLSMGGPYIGYIACTNDLMRKLPGRIVGMTNDSKGNRGYVLTLQAREQHIRREKANSNICSNESLMALNVGVYCSIMGKTGLIETQEIAYDNSHYLFNQLIALEIKGIKPFYQLTSLEFIKEFTLGCNDLINISKLNKYLSSKGYLGGIDLKNKYLLCATEMRSKVEMDNFIDTIKDYLVKSIKEED